MGKNRFNEVALLVKTRMTVLNNVLQNLQLPGERECKKTKTKAER